MGTVLRRSLLALGLGAGLGLAALAGIFPVLRGAACPVCYGLVKAAPGVWVEAAMPAPDRLRLQAELAAARQQVAAVFGSTRAQARLLVCASDTCDRRLGGRGAAAVTYFVGALAVVRVAPRGAGRVILAHELAHTELHARLGVIGQIAGRLPAWADEGLAVLVSDDPRYLRAAAGGGIEPARCRKEPRAELPLSPFDWAPLAGQERDIYAEAACAMARWMAENHGWDGVWAVLEGRVRLRRSAIPLAPAPPRP